MDFLHSILRVDIYTGYNEEMSFDRVVVAFWDDQEEEIGTALA